LSIGLSVDAVAHITHAYLHADAPLLSARAMIGNLPLMTDTSPACCCGMVGGADRRRRAVAAVLTMARPVFQGTGSSMLGLIALAFSRSNIFRTFFAILFTTVVLSLLHAVIVVPVLLAVVGPVTVVHEHGQGDGPEPGTTVVNKAAVPAKVAAGEPKGRAVSP